MLDPVTDISKFFKHFSAVIDRVTKGTHLLERNEFEGDKGKPKNFKIINVLNVLVGIA